MKKVLMLSMVVLCFAAVNSYGAVVNLDFESTSNGGVPTSYSGQGVVADAGNDYWNQATMLIWMQDDFQPDGLTVSGLLASDGVTASSIEVRLFDFFKSYNSTLGTNGLNTDHVFANVAQGAPVGYVDITGLDAAKTYDVYVYTRYSGWATEATFGGTSKVMTGGATAGFVEGDSYVKFTGLTGLTTISGTIKGADGGTFGSLAGLQIVEVPEPATMALLGLGSLLGLRRKK